MGWRRRFNPMLPMMFGFTLFGLDLGHASSVVFTPPEKPVPLSRKYLMARGRIDGSGRVVRPSIGMQQTFWVRVPNDTFGLIYQYAQRSATLRRTGRHCYLFVGDELSLPDSLLDDLQATYDSIIYPTCRKYFGNEWNPGIDNDSLVTVLFEPQMVGEFYFSSFDEMADSLAQTYGHRSNEREMFYIGLNAPPDSASTLRVKALMAHCQEHLISWYQNPPIEIWFNEACAMYAADLCGFGSANSAEVDSFRVNTSLDITQWPSGLIDYPANPSDPISIRRGMGYALLAYITDKYPGRDPQNPLIYHLVARRDLGRSFILSGFGDIEWAYREVGYWPPIHYQDIFPFWAIAIFLNDTTLGGPSKPYGYRKPLGGETHFVAEPTFGPPERFQTLPDSVRLYLPLLGQACVYIPSGKTDRRVEFVQDTCYYTIENMHYKGFVYNVNLATSTTDNFVPGTNTLTPLPPEATIPILANSTIKGVKFILSFPMLPGSGNIPATYFYAYAPLTPAETVAVKKAVYVFPNPFNPDREKVHFRYVVTAPSKVDIRVYDASGNQIAIVADEQWQTTPAIYNSQTWDGRNYRGVPVANGVYFGRVKVGDKTTGVKIAVMR